MKKDIKKKCAKIKYEENKTGGGLTEIRTTLKSYEDKILAITQLSMLGLSARFDNDQVEEISGLNFEDSAEEEEILLQFETSDDLVADISKDQSSNTSISNSCTENEPNIISKVKPKKKKPAGRTQYGEELLEIKKRILQLQEQYIAQELRAKEEINRLTIENLKVDLEMKRKK